MKLYNKITTLLKITLVMLMIVAINPVGSFSQPEGYCEPHKPQPTWPTGYHYCWPAYYMYYYGYVYYGSIISQFSVSELSGNVLMSNTTSTTQYNKYNTIDGFEFFPTKVAKVSPGETYKFQAKVGHIYGYNYYYCTSYYYIYRIFIDWNADGDFTDSGEWVNSPTGNYTNPIWRAYRSTWSPTSCNTLADYTYNIKIPDNIEPSIARMRVMTSYYYPSSPNPSTSYYDNSGTNPCHNGNWYDYTQFGWGYGYKYSQGETEDYVIEFQLPLKTSFPGEEPNDLLKANTAYDGTNGNPKPFVEFYSPMPAGTKMKFYIQGPLPFDDVVYTGLDPVDGTEWINVAGVYRYDMQKASGIASKNGDGTFYHTSGGEYVLTIVISKPGSTEKTLKFPFTVSWPDDIAIVSILSPRAAGAPDYFQYPRENPIGFGVDVQNVGEHDVTKFEVQIDIYNPSGTLVKTLKKTYDTEKGDKVLERGDHASVFMDESFATGIVGQYKVVATAKLLSADDDEAYNDRFRRLNSPEFYFSVQYEFQGKADAILFPLTTSQVIEHRPFRPVGQIVNLGLGDLSDVVAYFTYWKEPNGEQKTVQTIIKEINSGTQGNVAVAGFPSIKIDEAGTYKYKFSISVPNDGYLDDNQIEGTFTVITGLNGTYTIGTKNSGAANNYNTINLALDDLYLKGLSGNVVFEFTDDSYDIYSPFLEQPAWDLSSGIMGLGYDEDADVYRTLTFKPSTEKAASRASVVINLHSQNGVGIKFGTSSSNMNTNAIINQNIEPEVKALYYNNGGYITFDGGSQKSFKFLIHSEQPKHASVFYLDRGTHHTTIKNCLVENGTEATYGLTWLPRVSYNSAEGFKFQKDVTTTVDGTYGYSAGIVNRGSITDVSVEKNANLQPVANNNNTISNNEIKNFGYGIFSTGIGVNVNETSVFFKMYNTGTEISNNLINRVAGAGIFVGFEDGAKIFDNKIYKVNGNSTAYGILAGLNSDGPLFGYNNTNLDIYSNEINEVKASGEAVGTKIIQSKVILANSDGTTFTVPSTSDNINVYSNAIWDIRATSASAHRGGIYLGTERENYEATPVLPNFFITDATLANNTVIIENDSYNNTGFISGIAVQNASKLLLANNAIANLDEQTSSDVNSAVFFQGTRPDGENIKLDNNAYWVNSDASIVRFVEIDNNSDLVEFGYKNEFATLDQWRLYSGMDATSVGNYNFLNDLVIGFLEPISFNMKDNPAPKGSALNNRGIRINNIPVDLFGNQRGVQGTAYDIGAIEFNGLQYLTDIQPYGIIKENIRKESLPKEFSDAFYEMVGGATNFIAKIYNAGVNTQSQVPITINITVQNPDGTYSPVVTDTKYISQLMQSSFTEVDFNLNDGVGTEFVPKSYLDWNKERAAASLPLYSVPTQFKPMEANVSPIYRITFTSPLDEDNNNNTFAIDFRYYVKKSPIGLMAITPSDRTAISDTPTLEEIATKQNLINLNTALNDLGAITDYSLNKFDIDYLYLPGWNPRSYNFVPYNSIFFSDGDYENTATNWNINLVLGLQAFLESGSANLKKNLVIASQELARLNRNSFGYDFLSNYMKVENHYPSNPFGINGDYDGNTVKGMSIAKNHEFTIQSTGIDGDDYPKPGLLSIKDNEGKAQIGLIYTKLQQGKNGENDTEPYPNSERIMAVTANTLEYNTIYLAADWRHFAKPTDLIRGLSDYLEYYEGNILPVSLMSFDAIASGKRVDLSWATSEEQNSLKFEVEKSIAGDNSFNKIAEVSAKGRSIDVVKYGPVKDFDVEFGKSYSYRLKIVDKDGSFGYSPIETVNLNGQFGNIELGEILPNPSVSESKLELNLSNDVDVNIELFDMAGHKVATLMDGKQGAGTHSIVINSRNLSNGTYTIILTSGDVIITRQLQVVK